MREKNARLVNEWNVPEWIRVLHAQEVAFTHQKANAATRVTLIRTILPRPKFSDDWHPGTDHMPFAVVRPLLRAAIHIRHNRVTRPHAYTLLENAGKLRASARKHLFYYISFNRKCVFEFVLNISVDTSFNSAIGEKLYRKYISLTIFRRRRRVKSVMQRERERLNMKYAGANQYITRIRVNFSNFYACYVHTLLVMRKKPELDSIPLCSLTRSRRSSILERI